MNCKTLVLNVTHSCNLACRYCFVRASEYRQPGVMTLALATRAIDTLFLEKECHVGFFGGEPLLAWPLITAVVDHCRKKYEKCTFSITTNGTLLDAHKARLLADNNFSTILSIDGNPHRHDALRPFTDGSGSFRATWTGLRHLAQAGHGGQRSGLQPTLRSTFTAAGCDLAKELEFLNRLCDCGCGAGVAIEPVSLTEGCAFSRHAISPARLMQMCPAYMDAAAWFVDRVNAGKPARFHHLTSTLDRMIKKQGSNTECGAGHGYLTLNPAGEIHACHREGSLIGRLETDGIKWLPARLPWMDNRLETHLYCPSCKMRYVCGGGCRHDGLEALADLRKPSPLTCVLTRLRVAMAQAVMSEVGFELTLQAMGRIIEAEFPDAKPSPERFPENTLAT